jgi:iron-sulfur cluster repair protein YtfE (RIC family)
VHGPANPELVAIADIFDGVREDVDIAQRVAAMARIRELARDYAVPANGCATWRITLQELEAFEQDLLARLLAASPAG